MIEETDGKVLEVFLLTFPTPPGHQKLFLELECAW